MELSSRSRFSIALLVACVAGGAGGVTAAAKFYPAEHVTPLAASVTPTAIGPFYTSQTAFDSTNGNWVGGHVGYYTAGADTLKIGQVVYLSATNTVRVSTSAANHEKCIGVVVGGRSTSMAISTAIADVGSVASVPSRPVLILDAGRYWVMNDAADTVRAGDRLKSSTNTAGKVMGATAAVTATAAANTQATTTAANPTQASTTIAYTNADTIRSGGTTVTSTAANGAIIGHSAATITNGAITAGAVTNGALTAGAVTVAGDGFTKEIGTVVKKTDPSATVLAIINGCR